MEISSHSSSTSLSFLVVNLYNFSCFFRDLVQFCIGCIDVILFIHLLKFRLHQVLFLIHFFNNPLNKIYSGSEGIQDSTILIILIILRLDVTQGNSKGLAFPNGLEIRWALLFHVSKALTSEALWSGRNSVLTAIPSICHPFILTFEL